MKSIDCVLLGVGRAKTGIVTNRGDNHIKLLVLSSTEVMLSRIEKSDSVRNIYVMDIVYGFNLEC